VRTVLLACAFHVQRALCAVIAWLYTSQTADVHVVTRSGRGRSSVELPSKMARSDVEHMVNVVWAEAHLVGHDVRMTGTVSEREREKGPMSVNAPDVHARTSASARPPSAPGSAEGIRYRGARHVATSTPP
jgi:hypothetical protein